MAEKSLALSNFTARKTEDGNFQKLSGALMIQKSIENILKTRIGTIPTNPEFGSSLQSYLPSPLDDILVETAERQLNLDVRKWEDRAENLSIKVTRDSQQKVLIITISFSYKNEKIKVNLLRESVDLTNRIIPLSNAEELEASSIFRTSEIHGYVDLNAEVVRIE
mgnify:CR=1 FL=1